MENYYDTLGVAETASQDEIKSAYRKLAMQFHPDRNQGNAEAEAKFKKINEAYGTLGDPQHRSQYDHQRKFGGHPGGNPFQNGGFDFNFNFGGDINDIINQFFNQGFTQRPTRNRDFTFNLHISLEDAFTGKATPVQFSVNGTDYNLNVNIPAGIENGARIRYQGHGDRSNPNVPPGDLYIQVQILEHPIFRRQGPNLQMEIELDALQAVIGYTQTIQCIDGNSVQLTIPPGTQHGAVLRLRERGMPNRHNGQPRGDCFVGIRIRVPTDLSEADKILIQDIINRRST